MSLWTCPVHGLYGGDVFCPVCGGAGDYTVDGDGRVGKPTGLSQVEPLSPQGLEPTAFDPSREWHFAFESPIGARHLRSGFWCIEAGFGDPSDANPLWWDHDNRRWLAHDEVPWGKNNPARTFTLGSSAPCRSFAAFRRHVRRHADKLAGHRVRLMSRWVGCDVVASGMSAGTAETRSGSGLQPASPVGESRDTKTEAEG